MNAFSLQTKVIAGVVLALAVVLLAYCEKRSGIQIGQVEQKITASAEHVKHIEAAVAAVDRETKVEVARAATKRSDYHAARAKVQLKGDSVIADGQRVELPSVAAALAKADTMSRQDSTAIKAQARSDTLEHVLVGALNDHVDLLQEEKRPRCSATCGIVVGTVGTALVVVIAVKVIQALGHK